MSAGKQHSGEQKHESVQPLLNDFVDGALSAVEQARVESHLRDCSSCRAEVASVRALLKAARALSPDMAPKKDLWPDLEKRIRQRPVVVASERPSRSFAYPVRELSPRWMLGGIAAAAMILVLAAAVWWAGRDDALPMGAVQVPSAPRAAMAAQPDPGLMSAVVRGLEIECMGAGKLFQASLTPDVRGRSIAASVLDGVELVDRSIAETRAALETHPDDAQLVRQLTMRYQQKLGLLLGVTRLAGNV